MKNLIKASILLALIIGFILGLVKVYIDIPDLDEQIVHLSIDQDDNLYIVLNTGTNEQVLKLDNNQRIVYTHTLKKAQGVSVRRIEDLKADSDGNIYVLVTSKDIESKVSSQDIIYLNTKSITGKEKIAARLKEPNVFYQYLNVHNSNSELQLLGYDRENQKIVQDSIQINPDGVFELSKQNIAAFAYPKDRGIYKFFLAGETLGCMSMSGEVYKNERGEMVKLSVKGINGAGQAISYITVDARNNIYVGEQKSGNLFQLDLDKKTALLKNRANENITKSSQLTYKDVYHLAISKEGHFAAAVKNNTSSQIVSANQDSSRIYNGLSLGLDDVLKLGIKYFILYSFICLVTMLLILILTFLVNQSKKILFKLIFGTVPIICIILISMGFLIFKIYTKEITSVYLTNIENSAKLIEKQVNIETIENITEHTGYSSEDYKNLQSQLEQAGIQSRLLRVKDNDIYILVDTEYPCFYKLSYFIKFKNLSLYEKVIETKKMQLSTITDSWGNHLVSIMPIIKDDEVIALLEASSFQELIDKNADTFLYRLTGIIGLIILIMLTFLILMFGKILMPLREIEKVLRNLKENKLAAKIPYQSKDEFFTISQTINNMTEDIQVQIYHLSTLSEKYFRFVPKKLFFLFNKKNISDLELGDMAKIDASIAITAIGYKKEKPLWEKRTLEQINKNFSIINQKIDEYNGILTGSNRQLSEITAIYPDSFDKSLEAALVVTDQLMAENIREPNQFITLLDKAEVELGIGGDDTRLSVVILSSRIEKLYENLEMLKQTGCRIILTEEAYKMIKNTDYYAFRYIGYIRQDDHLKINLYDFFQGDTEEIRKLKQDTKELFKEALNCFFERDFYKAKSLFSLVLRNNKEDEIARWYVFRCAYLYQYGTAKDDLNIVPYLK
jgi:methyl-accepting chemotaxis protein